MMDASMFAVYFSMVFTFQVEKHCDDDDDDKMLRDCLGTPCVE